MTTLTGSDRYLQRVRSRIHDLLKKRVLSLEEIISEIGVSTLIASTVITKLLQNKEIEISEIENDIQYYRWIGTDNYRPLDVLNTWHIVNRGANHVVTKSSGAS